MSDEFVIETRGLTRYFGRKKAVDGVNLQVPRGSMTSSPSCGSTLPRRSCAWRARLNAELARELGVAQELLTDARRRVEGALLGDSPAVRALRESIERFAADAELVMLSGLPQSGHTASRRGRPRRERRRRPVEPGLGEGAPDFGEVP